MVGKRDTLNFCQLGPVVRHPYWKVHPQLGPVIFCFLKSSLLVFYWRLYLITSHCQLPTSRPLTSTSHLGKKDLLPLALRMHTRSLDPQPSLVICFSIYLFIYSISVFQELLNYVTYLPHDDSKICSRILLVSSIVGSPI